MKKLPFICVLACAIICLLGCGVFGYYYWNLGNHYEKLQAESLNLQENNSKLNNQIVDNTKQLEEKEQYIEGQKEYISELTKEIQTLTTKINSFQDESSEEENEEDYNSESDPYPNLYAEKENELPQNEKKYVYLTFDDGPSNLTPKVLDLLDQYNAKATFFVVCKNNESYSEYLSEIVKRGHTLALHSYSHDYQEIYASVDAFLSDYEKVFDWVYKETGYTPFLFRFPGGSNNASSYVGKKIIQEMERRGFTYFDWNVSSGDGSNLTTTENIIDNICLNVRNVNYPVVLMHDGQGREATLAALPTVLENLSNAGYEFRSLDKALEPVQF
ncbi:MAG: polysaccharide deacetylase family protein [Lachnospiraceae bacterium]